MVERLKWLVLVSLLAGCVDSGTGPENQAPVVIEPVPDLMMRVGDTAYLEMREVFSDPDGDDLVYTVESTLPEIVSVTVLGFWATVVAHAEGEATVIFTATDPGGLLARTSAAITVVQRNRASALNAPIPNPFVGDSGNINLVQVSF